MSSRTYVCVACRWARRAPSFGAMAVPRCPLCQENLWGLEWRWRIPRKHDLPGWKTLAAKVARDSRPRSRPRPPGKDPRMAKLDRHIVRAKQQSESRRGTWRLRALRRKRAKLNRALVQKSQRAS